MSMALDAPRADSRSTPRAQINQRYRSVHSLAQDEVIGFRSSQLDNALNSELGHEHASLHAQTSSA